MILDYYGANLQKSDKNDRIYCPNNCGHSYTGTYRKKNLNRHFMYECGVEPQFPCHLCQKRFSQKCSLKKHVNFVHKAIF